MCSIRYNDERKYGTKTRDRAVFAKENKLLWHAENLMHKSLTAQEIYQLCRTTRLFIRLVQSTILEGGKEFSEQSPKYALTFRKVNIEITFPTV